MSEMLNVLIVEDSEDDALLLMRKLTGAGHRAKWQRVEDAKALRRALADETWDVILCDYKLPTFSAPDALKIVQEENLDIPFIVVSGTIGEETAVEVMKAGAHDYLMKDNLARLGAAIEREIRDCQIRQKKRLTENLLAKSEDNFRHSLDESPLGVRIISPRGQTVYANQELLNIYGYTSLEEYNAILHKDRYTPETYAGYLERKEMRKRGVDGPIRYEISIIRKDGQIRHLEVFRKKVLWNGEIHYQALYNDITERKRAEKHLLESELRYRLVVENAQESIVITQNGKIVYANEEASKSSGFPLTELIGKDFIGLIHEDDHQMVSNFYIQRLRGASAPVNYCFRIVCRDGSIKWAELNATAIELNGKPATINFMKDITEHKNLEREREESYRRIKDALNATVHSLATIVETRDPYTTGHQRRVSVLAEAIADEMGLGAERKEFITTAAVMHDIGKLSIPSEILSKPSRLSPIEYDLIKTHPEAGYNILKDIHFPWPVALVILQHHERMNGSGYPNNIKGDEILLEARIIAVADVVEAISSHRPYRPALGIDFALDEISKNRNTLYDPDVVDVCLKLFREKHFVLS
ncbi:MAG TPA: PAS domain S-box protein [Smithella sp.]|nr:PAS domain S-box protein [Smithella sp.]